MAKNKNPNDSRRTGAVKKRSQSQNPQSERWTERNTDTGLFINQKSDGTPFKGVRKEK
jgi:hypothetical protein